MLLRLMLETVGDLIVHAFIRPSGARRASTVVVATAWVIGLAATAVGGVLLVRSADPVWAGAGTVGIVLGIPMALVVTVHWRNWPGVPGDAPPRLNPGHDR